MCKALAQLAGARHLRGEAPGLAVRVKWAVPCAFARSGWLQVGTNANQHITGVQVSPGAFVS